MVQKGGFGLGRTFSGRIKTPENKNILRMKENNDAELAGNASYYHGVTKNDSEYNLGMDIQKCNRDYENNPDGLAACQKRLFGLRGLEGGKSKSRKNKKRVGKKGAKKTTRARKTSKARKTSRSRKYKK